MALNAIEWESVWGDVVPVLQDDGPNPVVPIAYAAEYKTAMDYFRAAIAAEEKSDRVLDLTSYIIQSNPSHYTIWKVRQDVLLHLQKDLAKELDFIQEMADQHPKSYQIWHHRQIVVDKLGDSSKELAFVNEMIGQDSKNYHCWSYRQWLVTRFQLWHSELVDMNRLIDEDVRNNSAWNHRFFYFTSRPNGFSDADLADEIKFTIQMIRLAPHNESPWNYLRGILKHNKKRLNDIADVTAVATQYATGDRPQYVSFAGSLMLDWIVEEMSMSPGMAEEFREKGKKVCDELAEKDPIRARFWMYRKKGNFIHVRHQFLFIGAGAILYTSGCYAGFHAYRIYSLPTPPETISDPAHQPPSAHVYNNLAGKYDGLIDWDEWLIGMRRRRADLLRKCKGKVLELAAGTGRNMESYPNYLKNGIGLITMTDASAEMLQEGYKKYKDNLKLRARLPPVMFKLVDVVGELPFADGEYDTVVDAFGLCSYRDPVKVLREMGRVCKPEEGRVLLLEHGRGHWDWLNLCLDKAASGHADKWGCWWNRDVLKMVNDAGLEVLEIKRYHFGTTYQIVAKPRNSLLKQTK
ncbi:Methyltransferase-like protein 7B [Irineochytrium annulatum]|nr:Methyltransferase-like protein 7B [Irineochytrium annulatum]